MNSQILSKVNDFIKNRLIELLGILLIFISIFLLVSIASYSPSDPNFIYSPETVEIKNVGGFYGSAISDFILQSIGLISFLFCINLFVWGYKIIIEKKIQNFSTTSVWQIKGLDRIFYMLCYMVFGTVVLNIYHNDSFWLIDNGNGGYVGRVIRENIYYFSPLIENQYVIYGLIFFTIVFFYIKLKYKAK